MKKLSRWLFVLTHYSELVAVADFVRAGVDRSAPMSKQLAACGKIEGALFVMESLNLMDSPNDGR